MLSHWRIRNKLLLGAAMLFLIVAILAFSSFQGVYAYRRLVRSISVRATELPLSAALERRVGEMRYTFSRANHRNEFYNVGQPAVDSSLLREQFHYNYLDVRESLRRYREQLDGSRREESRIDDRKAERTAVHEIEQSLERIAALNRDEDWLLDGLKISQLRDELDALDRMVSELPSHLQSRMHTLADDVRVQYRVWIVLTWVTSMASLIMLALSGHYFYVRVFSPLRVLVYGSRRVAKGEFDHRIQLNTNDEMAELAGALNDMTSKFQQIRDELNSQVRERTKEVVRSEQLASVGFLAAGVAHEINNPLASIAWAAESLESRIDEILDEDTPLTAEERQEQVETVLDYLRRIQEEAFRCNGITERLLDFSRLGDMEKHQTDLTALVQDVIDMVRHLGKYRDKSINFVSPATVSAPVNPQEMKQVVLNLITNGLDSLDAGGTVDLQLREAGGMAELIVRDDGCGMSEDVLEHLFEPFFTRRRDGQGTGLGLSITYRIITDHGGKIAAASRGAGCGAEFRVTLPMEQHEESNQKRQAA